MPQSLHVLSAHIIFSTKERQPIAFRGGQEIHSRSGKTAQTRNIPRRIFAHSEKIPRLLRRTIFVGLNFGLPFQGGVPFLNVLRALPSATMVGAFSASAPKTCLS